MLIVISPSKTLDYKTPVRTQQFSMPVHLSDAQTLVERMRRYSVAELMTLMGVSENIAALNVTRFAQWRQPFTQSNARQAVLAFKGDVYTGLSADTFSEEDFDFAQQHLRILSGLYGVLRPLDLMQAYRLEMGRKIDTCRGKNLYEFWGNVITENINLQLSQTKGKHLINLASNEYFKAIKLKQLNAQVITPEFKDYKNGTYKMMGVYAKKARGMLSRYIIQKKITDPRLIKAFDQDGYHYNQEMSKGNTWVFTRKR